MFIYVCKMFKKKPQQPLLWTTGCCSLVDFAAGTSIKPLIVLYNFLLVEKAILKVPAQYSKIRVCQHFWCKLVNY